MKNLKSFIIVKLKIHYMHKIRVILKFYFLLDKDLVKDFSGKTVTKWALKVAIHLFTEEELTVNVLEVCVIYLLIIHNI